MNQAQAGVDTVLLAPVGQTDGSTRTASLDTINSGLTGRAGHITIRVLCNAEETTHAANSTLSLLHSDDTVVTNHVTMVADQSLDLTAAKEVRYELDARKLKRYLRLTCTAGTTTGGNITVAAVATMSRCEEGPESTTEMGDDTVVIF